MTGTAKVDVDTGDAKRELDQLERHADLTAKTVIATTRKGYQSLVLLADIMGETIPMYVNLMASAAFMAAEMFAEIATAETASGYLIGKAAITFGLAAMLFYRGVMLQQQAGEIEDKLNSTYQLVNMWT
jgi:hypothetical protein